MDFKGSGQESFIAFAEEATYGTAAVLTDSTGTVLPFIREGVFHRRNQIQGHSSLGQVKRKYISRLPPQTGGPLSFEMWHAGLEIVLKYALGDHYTTTNPTTGEYISEFRVGHYIPEWKSVADPSAQSLTMWIGRGALSTAGYVHRFTGTVFNGLRARFDPRGMTLDTDVLFYDSSELAVPPAVVQSWFDHGYLPWPAKFSVELADPTTGSATWCDVTSFGAEIEVVQNLTQEYPMGLNGGTAGLYPLPLPPVRTDAPVVRGSFDMLAGLSTTLFGTYTLRQLQESNRPMHLRYNAYGVTNPTAANGDPFLHKVEMDAVRIIEIDPMVNDAAVIKRHITWEAFEPTVTSQTGTPVMGWQVSNGRSGFGIR